MSAVEMAALSVTVAGGYLLGSVPLAWLVARIHHGEDIRTLGSGNVGVLNTALSVHRWAGLLVFAGEIAKGVLAVVVPRLLLNSDVAVGLTALAAFVGTRWPVWLLFRGGRGNTLAATSVALISPLTIGLMALLWFTARRLSGTNFIATRVVLAALPASLAVLTMSWWWAAVGMAYSVLFLTTHRPETDDHLLLKEHYPTVAAFLTSPPRGRHSG
jgi:acyl phosphate:glycerol-3-phosphate acyltransferase